MLRERWLWQWVCVPVMMIVCSESLSDKTFSLKCNRTVLFIEFRAGVSNGG
jgi:hypothetical protein